MGSNRIAYWGNRENPRIVLLDSMEQLYWRKHIARSRKGKGAIPARENIRSDKSNESQWEGAVWDAQQQPGSQDRHECKEKQKGKTRKPHELNHLVCHEADEVHHHEANRESDDTQHQSSESPQ